MFRNANAMMVAEVSCKSMASIPLVALSMQVSTYLAEDIYIYTPSYVIVSGSGSMMSMCTVSNLPDGRENGVVSILVHLENLC